MADPSVVAGRDRLFCTHSNARRAPMDSSTWHCSDCGRIIELGGSIVPTTSEIAKNLNEAQRRAVLALSETLAAPPRGLAYWAGSLGTSLAAWQYESVATSSRRLYRLTPLGLAVRQHLLEQQQ